MRSFITSINDQGGKPAAFPWQQEGFLRFCLYAAIDGGRFNCSRAPVSFRFARANVQAARSIAFCPRRSTELSQPHRVAIFGDGAPGDVEAFGLQHIDELAIGEDRFGIPGGNRGEIFEFVEAPLATGSSARQFPLTHSDVRKNIANIRRDEPAVMSVAEKEQFMVASARGPIPPYGVAIRDALADPKTRLDELKAYRDHAREVLLAQGDLKAALAKLDAEIAKRSGKK